MPEPANPTERVIRRRHGLIPIDFRELWRYRELFLFLTWRDILVRYKQTVIGVAWAVVQPIITMVILTVIFSRLARLPSHDAPYAVMTFAAVLPWQFFSSALNQGSGALLGAANMIRKVYFPRLIIPASVTLSGTVDFLVSFLILIALMAFYGVTFSSRLILLPGFFLLGAGAALGVALWLGALNVKYRDVKHVVPFLVRMGMYISPVGFMSDIIPDRWRFLYSVNPMVGVIDGFRWCILGPQFEPYWPGLWVSVGVVAAILISGAYYFRSTERTFADVI